MKAETRVTNKKRKTRITTLRISNGAYNGKPAFVGENVHTKVWRQIVCFGGRDVGFKIRVAILGPLHVRSMVLIHKETWKLSNG